MIERVPEPLKKELDIFVGDIRDPILLRSALKGIEIAFHLASLIAIPYSYRAPSSYVETNVSGTLNVLEAALENGVEKVVHTSTSEVYGTARYTPIGEEHPLQGQSPYSASKIGADKIAESFHLSFGLPVATLRPFNTYGPRQSARAIIPTIICQALARDRIELGLLTPVRDLTFVEDVVDGFLKAAESEEAVGKVINVGTGQGISIGELAREILNLLGLDKPLIEKTERFRPQESEVMMLVCDNRKAQTMLGWSPRTKLDEGLRRTIEYYRKNLSIYKSEIYNI
jgi:NAD dependent epimerase/dehydratase